MVLHGSTISGNFWIRGRAASRGTPTAWTAKVSGLSNRRSSSEFGVLSAQLTEAMVMDMNEKAKRCQKMPKDAKSLMFQVSFKYLSCLVTF